jgi:hypothetical protein
VDQGTKNLNLNLMVYKKNEEKWGSILIFLSTPSMTETMRAKTAGGNKYTEDKSKEVSKDGERKASTGSDFNFFAK